MKYDNNLKAVIIGYENIKFLNNIISSFYDRIYLTMHVRVTFIILKIKQDDYLVGNIRKVHPEHINVLLFGIFNCTILTNQNLFVKKGKLLFNGKLIFVGSPLKIKIEKYH